MKKNPTVREALNEATEKLTAAGLEDPVADAEYLLTGLLGIKRHEMFLNPEQELTEAEAARLEEFIERRGKREPAQLITGECEFRGLGMRVTRDVLVPRPETELLVDEALKAAAHFKKEPAPVAIDLCAGSGCVAVSFAIEAPRWHVYATDISSAALAVARENARANNVADRVEFTEGDLFTPLAGVRAHIILSNPPYVTAADMRKLPPEVALWEPAGALYGGPDGLGFYRRIVAEAHEHLATGGFLIMEMGWGQAAAIKELLEKDGRFAGIDIKKDFSGIERIVVARMER